MTYRRATHAAIVRQRQKARRDAARRNELRQIMARKGWRLNPDGCWVADRRAK